MIADNLFVFAILCGAVVLSEILARKTFLRHVGASLLVIVLTAVMANLGVIPTSAEKAPIYDGIFSFVAPMAIFQLLLAVHLKDVFKAGGPMILMFLTGSAGTIVGVVLGMEIIHGSDSIGSFYRAIGGMYTGTYIGGSINFNAIALHYGVMKQGTLFAGAVAVDNIITTLWMLACLVLPKVMERVRPSGVENNRGPVSTEGSAGDVDSEMVHSMDLAILLSGGAFAIWLSNRIAGLTHLPSILILTTTALVFAQFPLVRKLRGARLLGTFGLLLFLAVIGAFCDLKALREIGNLGISLLLLAFVIVGVHGAILFGLSILFRVDPVVTAVASQANIGGPASAAAVARSLGRSDLLLPGILVGMLGYAIGNYAGFLVAEFLLR